MKKSEHHEQIKLIAWANSMDLPIFAIPNGGARHASTGAKLKREGVRPGVPDLMLPVASCGFHGLFIEMKAEGGRVSKKQKQWIARLNTNGYLAVVCYGFEDARKCVEDYLDGNNLED